MEQQHLETMEFMERYQILGKLGEGAFGKVLHAVDRTRKIEVAIKIVELTAIPVGTAATLGRHLSTEMESHYRATSHPNIVALHKVYHLTHMIPNQGGVRHRLAVVMELAHGGTLTKHYEAVLLVSQGVAVSEDRVRWFFQQYIAALDHLHSWGITHRDIKACNTLLEANPMTADRYPSIKICDFGLSKIMEQEFITGTDVGTQDCKAPEVFLNHDGYNPRQADVWSLGVMLYGMLAGQLPFRPPAGQRLTPLMHSNMLNSEAHWAEMWQRLAQLGRSPAAISLVQQMLNRDPNNRITLDAIRQNVWFNTNRGSNARAKLAGEGNMQLRTIRGLCEQTLEEVVAVTQQALTAAGIPIVPHV